MEDRDLLAAISRGDRTSFNKFFRRYIRLVRAIAFRILENWADAEDAAQEAFLTFFQISTGYSRLGNPKAWLSKIAVNASFTLLHRKSSEAKKMAAIIVRHRALVPYPLWPIEDQLDLRRRFLHRTDPSTHERCSKCGKIRPVVKRDSSNGAVCRNCYTKNYYRDTSKHEPCSKCGRVKRVATRNGFGKAVCPSCYKKDPSRHRPCSKCGQARPVEVHDDSGKDTCKACHYKDPSKYRVCSKCGKIRPVQTRDSSGRPLCSSCDKRQRRTKKPLKQHRRRLSYIVGDAPRGEP